MPRRYSPQSKWLFMSMKTKPMLRMTKKQQKSNFRPCSVWSTSS